MPGGRPAEARRSVRTQAAAAGVLTCSTGPPGPPLEHRRAQGGRRRWQPQWPPHFCLVSPAPPGACSLNVQQTPLPAVLTNPAPRRPPPHLLVLLQLPKPRLLLLKVLPLGAQPTPPLVPVRVQGVPPRGALRRGGQACCGRAGWGHRQAGGWCGRVVTWVWHSGRSAGLSACEMPDVKLFKSLLKLLKLPCCVCCPTNALNRG